MDQQTPLSGYFSTADCDIEAFKKLVNRQLTPEQAPSSTRISANVPVYEVAVLGSMLDRSEGRRRLMAEWASLLKDGPGVLILEGAFSDVTPIDMASAVYDRIIAEERQQAGGGADHFAAAGANDRIWNSLQKLCLEAPEVFAAYFANPVLAAVCEAWLGPDYQMTAQINLVRPGGAAQQVHRDYHLGFQTEETCERYPAHVHDLSPFLTLQGAVAHTDMPVESGPTKLLPFSQLYRPGYAAYRLEPFKQYFEETCVQLPLKKGDAVFFNPALFHAAGANRSQDVQRMANLLQVSSAFGRTMETVDRQTMCLRLYPVLLESVREDKINLNALEAAVSACAEGYSFPTNLDTDPPIGGLAPESQKQVFLRALNHQLTLESFEAELQAQSERRMA